MHGGVAFGRARPQSASGVAIMNLSKSKPVLNHHSRRELFSLAAGAACMSLAPLSCARADVRPENFSSEEIVDNGHRFFWLGGARPS